MELAVARHQLHRRCQIWLNSTDSLKFERQSLSISRADGFNNYCYALADFGFADVLSVNI